MDRDSDASARTHDTILTLEENRKIALAQRQAQFQMFMAGLIFATLSFSGAHPINIPSLWQKTLEIIAMILLLISGFALLAKLAEIQLNPEINFENLPIFKKCFVKFVRLINEWQSIYWVPFFLGMICMVINRCALLFH